jgi:hypothetical protein
MVPFIVLHSETYVYTMLVTAKMHVITVTIYRYYSIANMTLRDVADIVCRCRIGPCQSSVMYAVWRDVVRWVYSRVEAVAE